MQLARRFRRSIMALGLVLCASCGNTVTLSEARFPALTERTEVEVIDGSGMSRSDLERTLGQFDVIARTHALVSPGDAEQLERVLENTKGQARRVGGNAILWVQDSQQVAVIMQNARYAGPEDAIVMYLMRRKSG